MLSVSVKKSRKLVNIWRNYQKNVGLKMNDKTAILHPYISFIIFWSRIFYSYLELGPACLLNSVLVLHYRLPARLMGINMYSSLHVNAGVGRSGVSSCRLRFASDRVILVWKWSVDLVQKTWPRHPIHQHNPCMHSSHLNGIWYIWRAAPPVQLFDITGNGWPHNAPRSH